MSSQRNRQGVLRHQPIGPFGHFNEWVVLADMIDRAVVEVEYSALFKSTRGRPAASSRIALCALSVEHPLLRRPRIYRKLLRKK